MVYGKKSLLVNILRVNPLFPSTKNKEILIFGRRFWVWEITSINTAKCWWVMVWILVSRKVHGQEICLWLSNFLSYLTWLMTKTFLLIRSWIPILKLFRLGKGLLVIWVCCLRTFWAVVIIFLCLTKVIGLFGVLIKKVFLWILCIKRKLMIKFQYHTSSCGNPSYHKKSKFLSGWWWETKFSQKITWKKRNWKGSQDCCFCGCDESIDHLFFHYPIARYVWRVIQVALNLVVIPKSINGLCDG
jgi:hypothetical protein